MKMRWYIEKRISVARDRDWWGGGGGVGCTIKGKWYLEDFTTLIAPSRKDATANTVFVRRGRAFPRK